MKKQLIVFILLVGIVLSGCVQDANNSISEATTIPNEVTPETVEQSEETVEQTAEPINEPTSEPVTEVTTKQGKLTLDELTYKGASMLMTEEEVVAELGEPKNKETFYEEALGYDRLIYVYDDVELLFDKDIDWAVSDGSNEPFVVSKIMFTDSSVESIRNTSVGDTAEDVIGKFEGNLDGEKTYCDIVLYGKADYSEDYGFASYDNDVNDDDSKLIQIIYGGTNQEGKSCYLSYTIENGVVTEIVYGVDLVMC